MSAEVNDIQILDPIISVLDGDNSGTFRTRLTVDPGGDATYPVKVIDAGFTASPTSLTFTSTNFSDPQTVTVTRDGGSVATRTTITVNDPDNTYQAHAQLFFIEPNPEITLLNASIILTEVSRTVRVDITLSDRPDGDIVISLADQDTVDSLLEISPATLTFTNVNFQTAQTVILTSVAPASTSAVTSTVVVSVSDDSTGTSYASATARQIQVTHTIGLGDADAESAVPCFAAGSRIQVRASGATAPIESLCPGDTVFDAAGKPHRLVKLATAESRVLTLYHGVLLTPNHQVVVGQRRVFVGDAGGGVTRTLGAPVAVYHLCLDEWTTVRVGRVECETAAWLPHHHAFRTSYGRATAARALGVHVRG
jgi:hypothetical protein